MSDDEKLIQLGNLALETLSMSKTIIRQENQIAQLEAAHRGLAEMEKTNRANVVNAINTYWRILRLFKKANRAKRAALNDAEQKGNDARELAKALFVYANDAN